MTEKFYTIREKYLQKQAGIADATYGQGAKTGALIGAGSGGVGGLLAGIPGGPVGMAGAGLGFAGAGALKGSIVGLGTVAIAKALKILERKYNKG